MPHIILRTIHTLWALTLSQMVCVFLFCVFIETVPALQLSLKKEGETNEIFWVSHSNCVRVFRVTLFTSLSLSVLSVFRHFLSESWLYCHCVLCMLCVCTTRNHEKEREYSNAHSLSLTVHKNHSLTHLAATLFMKRDFWLWCSIWNFNKNWKIDHNL